MRIATVAGPFIVHQPNNDGLVQDGSNSSALAMALLQSYTKPSIWYLAFEMMTPRHRNVFRAAIPLCTKGQ